MIVNVDINEQTQKKKKKKKKPEPVILSLRFLNTLKWENRKMTDDWIFFFLRWQACETFGNRFVCWQTRCFRSFLSLTGGCREQCCWKGNKLKIKEILRDLYFSGEFLSFSVVFGGLLKISADFCSWRKKIGDSCGSIPKRLSRIRTRHQLSINLNPARRRICLVPNFPYLESG